MIIRRATPKDVPAIEALLARCDLPVAGVRDAATTLWVGDIEGPIIGAVGYEARGEVALLRSLALDPAQRGHGLGMRLLQHVIAEARKAGFKQAAGLTTTIPDLLKRLGFTEGPQSSAPKPLLHSAEFRGACPDTARFFLLDL